MSGQIKNPNQFYYQGMPDFILREGQFFEPRPLPAGIDHLEIRHCYKNAFQTALEESFVYVEGYALSASHNLQSFTHGTWTEMASLWIEPGTHMAESISEFFFLWM